MKSFGFRGVSQDRAKKRESIEYSLHSNSIQLCHTQSYFDIRTKTHRRGDVC